MSLKYCQETLKNNEPSEEYKECIKNKKKQVSEVMKMTDGSFSTSIETFEQMVRKFQRAGKRSYDFLTKASKSFQKAVFNFTIKMIEEEQFPSKFQNTTLHNM